MAEADFFFFFCGQVKFIKFFAWEERWIQRALDAREVEMGWMIKCESAFF